MDKRVLVTGGAKGIGAAIVRELAGAGYAVDFTYNSSKRQADDLVGELAAAGGGAVTARAADLADRAQAAALAEAIEADEAGYYGFVHNAGRPYDSLAAMVEVEAAAPTMEVNFWAMVRLIRAVARRMTAARAGRIVLIGSVAAARGSQGNAIYAASKAALEGYCATLSGEVGRRGVTANVVAPGYVDTEMMAPYAEFREALVKRIPARRLGAPEDVAAVVGFLLSERAGYVNGAVVTVDGGLGASLGLQR